MLSAHLIEHRYRDRLVLAVEEISLEAGTVTALAGPNGSGKSTLLRVLACVEQPTSGDIVLAGQRVITAQERRAARLRMTLVEQHPLLFRGTVMQNLRSALSFHGLRGAEATRRAAAALDRLELGPLRQRDARSLSDGETQRVAIARGLALRPDVLLLDEPVSAADPATTAALYRELEVERARGAAICFASHQIEAAYRWSGRLLALADGRLSPVVPVNLFRATVPQGSGPRLVRAGPLEIQVVTDLSGPATIAIPPDDVVVSPAPLRSSARNAFPGRVIGISDDGRGGVVLTADVGVDIRAHITRAALEDLDLRLGSPVVITFKTMAVRVF